MISSMELYYAAALKKLRSYLKVALFMARKGLISKRSKLIMDMNLIMKRGKLASKSLRGLIFHHQRYWSPVPLHGGEYDEFSCSSSPRPVFFHVKRRRNYFPCLITVTEEHEHDSPHQLTVVGPRMVECSRGLPEPELAHGDEAHSSPLLSPSAVSISNYSNIEEEDINGGWEVDEQAEEFIRSFYEQLRMQRRTVLLEYNQDVEKQNHMEELSSDSYE